MGYQEAGLGVEGPCGGSGALGLQAGIQSHPCFVRGIFMEQRDDVLWWFLGQGGVQPTVREA